MNTREDSKKYGIFTDSFMNDNQRDQGLEQSAAILNNTLTLPIRDLCKIHFAGSKVVFVSANTTENQE